MASELTDEMVEAAARAMCKAQGRDPDKKLVRSDNYLWWQSYQGEARAALAAALAVLEREHAVVPFIPTPEMLAAWWRQKNTGTQVIPPQDATEIDTSDYAAYRAMLSASQEPKP